MAIVIEQGASPQIGGVVTNVASAGSGSFTATVGRSIIVMLVWDSGSGVTVSGVSMSGASNGALSSTGDPVSRTGIINTTYIQIWYLSNIGTGGSQEVTVTLSANLGGGYMKIAVYEVSGLETSGAFDVEGQATGSSTTPSCTVVPTTANGLLIGTAASGSSDPTAGSGYTLLTQDNWNYYNNGQYLADYGASGSKTFDMSTTGSDDWAIKAAAFKALGGGPALTKKVKFLAHPSAQSASGIEVVVFSAPSGSDYITGTTRYGSDNALSFDGTLDTTTGQAVLKVTAADVGADALAVDTVVAGVARNTTYTTGVISGTIIEE